MYLFVLLQPTVWFHLVYNCCSQKMSKIEQYLELAQCGLAINEYNSRKQLALNLNTNRQGIYDSYTVNRLNIAVRMVTFWIAVGPCHDGILNLLDQGCCVKRCENNMLSVSAE
jgi:hypothetical protein